MHLRVASPTIHQHLSAGSVQENEGSKVCTDEKTDYFCGTQASGRYLKGKDKGRY